MLAVTRFSKLLLLSGCLSVAGCACVTTSIDSELAEMVADVANLYAADARLSVWEVKVNETSDGWTIEGKTDRKEALDELNSRLHAKKMPVDVRVTVLPQDNAQIGDKSWALVNVSVATVKKEPRFAVAATTQALAGTPLRLLEFKAPFWRVQMPDGYIGWVHSAQIKRLSQAQLSDWNAADHLVVTARTSELKDSAGAILMPLTVGSRLKMLDRKRGQVQAQLPDGRIGWIVAADVMDARAHASHWQVMRSGSREAFWKAYIAQAKRLLGTPYLWGGTSASGVDCSGFVSLMWQMVGIVSMRDADQLIVHANRLNLQSLDEIPVGGYLAFGRIDETGKPKVEHIGISLGQGDFIHSLGSVRIESVNPASECFNAYERSRFLGAYAVDLNVIKASLLVPMQKNRFYRTPPQPLQLR